MAIGCVFQSDSDYCESPLDIPKWDILTLAVATRTATRLKPMGAMSRPRRIILTVYLGALVLVCLWVPWTRAFPGDRYVFLGYGPVWSSPPDKYFSQNIAKFGAPDFGRLALEVLALTALAGITLLLTGNKEQCTEPAAENDKPTAQAKPPEDHDLCEMGNYLASIGTCDSCRKDLERPLFCCGRHRAAGVAYCKNCFPLAVHKELIPPQRLPRHVLLGPRLIMGQVYRLVCDPPDAVAQTWHDGVWWEGGGSVELLRRSPPTPTKQLRVLGIPQNNIGSGICEDLASHPGARPELLSEHTSEKPVVEVLVGPNLIRNRICRIVLTQDRKAVTEEWCSDQWLRTRGFLSEVLGAPLATEAQLDGQGVPPADRITDGPNQPGVQ